VQNLIRNETIKGQVAKAIAVIKAKAFLADLRETLDMGKFTLPQQDLTKLETIEKYLRNPKSDKGDLEICKDSMFDKVQEMQGSIWRRID